MVKYPEDEQRTLILGSRAGFVPWQPSTWPSLSNADSAAVASTMKQIIEGTVLLELQNVLDDAKKSHGSLEHRGHVIAIALMCALDAVASYGYRGKHLEKFVRNHFPNEYRPYSDRLYGLYRNSLVHSWNLFEASLLPGREPIQEVGGTLVIGVLGLMEAFSDGAKDYIGALETDSALRQNTVRRYESLRSTARP